MSACADYNEFIRREVVEREIAMPDLFAAIADDEAAA